MSQVYKSVKNPDESAEILLMRTVTMACLSWCLAGCAGPMTPFGAIQGFGSKVSKFVEKAIPARNTLTRVRFQPRHQLLHASTPFSVIIEDANGVPDDFELTLVYNGENVSREFMRHAEYTQLDPLGRQLKLTVNSLRLMPGRDNNIYAVYQRKQGGEKTVAQYQPPFCPAFESGRQLASVPEFDTTPAMIYTINKASRQRHLNPYLVAGLIAQESAFNPLAISRRKALGLTQITSAGEAEIVKKNSSWPRSPELVDMSVPSLRFAVLRGQIHSGNEWRLNPELSIIGGVEYLNYISDYWRKPEKQTLLTKDLITSDSAFTEIMLASYNSGPARVSEAVQRRGQDWLNDNELKEAKKYVRSVSSYCDHFANKGE